MIGAFEVGLGQIIGFPIRSMAGLTGRDLPRWTEMVAGCAVAIHGGHVCMLPVPKINRLI